MLRVAVYGRHSTDKQNPTSSADQAAACGRVVDYLGGEVVGTYLDPELSGYRRDRPGLRRLLKDVRDGRIDVVVSEALDRLARDAEDVAWIGKKLKFSKVRLHTVSEGEIDEIKLAVASLLGAIFLSQLQQKTFRGQQAAVLAGRFAGGRAYGYRLAQRHDERGERIRGELEIDPDQAEVVRRIFREFADGRSSIAIATGLNKEGVPGPRGGQWNASTVRGDPAKLVGIINNPLYRGKVVWGRREWRKDPDSDRRERRYRLRDKADWLEIDAPDLRIVDDALAAEVGRQIEARRRPATGGNPVHQRRARHLLSGILRCGTCGSRYVISGKDYYRCAGQKERGTCANSVSVRRAPAEDVVLSTLQDGLLTEEHAAVFVHEFRREVDRLRAIQARQSDGVSERIAVLDREIGNLTANLLAGVVSETARRMLADREAERSSLAQRAHKAVMPVRALPSEAALVESFKTRVSRLREALGDDEQRASAAQIIADMLESVVVHPTGADGQADAELVASTAKLVVFAAGSEDSRGFCGRSSSTVVAGTGFEPVTFRL